MKACQDSNWLKRHLCLRRAMFCLVACAWSATAAFAEELPSFDLKAVQDGARREAPGRSYVDALPERRAECWAAARPFASSRSVDALLKAGRLRQLCLNAMIIKLAEIYYDADGFGSDGMAGRLETVGYPVAELFFDIATNEPSCRVGSCQNTLGYSLAADWYTDYLADLVVALAVYNRAAEPQHFDRAAWLAAWEEAGRY